MNSGNLRAESEKPERNKLPVKLEIEESFDEEEHSPLNKRYKLSSPFHQQWSLGIDTFPVPPLQYNLLNEPSPLGLRLKKSPSLLDLIQMKLGQGNTSTLGNLHYENLELGRKDLKSIAASGTDKLKASNFPASLLRIGKWECVSRYEGDLVAKCYFAKHKIVWEVLDGGLKNKMEIQWSDIVSLNAYYPDNGPGTLDIVLTRQPLFFRETNPQPRKHTLWQATADFTGGEASLHRRHFLQCPQGLLGKHFEKLIQCDPRLNLLSRQPEIMLDSPYFDPRASIFEDPDESKCHGFDPLTSACGSTVSGLQDAASPSVAQSSSAKSELWDPVGRAPEHLSMQIPSPSSGAKSELWDPVSRAPEYLSMQIPSPSSVMDTHGIEENRSSEIEESRELSNMDQFKVPGLHPSMSMSDLVSHIGHCISGQVTSGNPLLSGEGLRNSNMLEDITQYLLSDSQLTSASDEQSLMSRVNSFCCLLQKDPATVQNLQLNCEDGLHEPDDGTNDQSNTTYESESESEVTGCSPAPEGESTNDVSGCKKTLAISRKDSFGELLLSLPRIASLSQLLVQHPRR
ncbi:hypothetical protein HHK36_021229 [Tetracentron sinense]|uniref:TRF2/HOY1 PH-like domain-containing protein n=1 Tax=Tetracentron sinense TaxID=13715 RepID=A0A835D6W3_TETSI|nr:hypothetical protein HHK36_021229 [Tetracentron sinense]